MKKTILILSIMALVFASCKRDEILNEGDKWYNGHAAVDLGLPSGLYWATCNIGASVPEEMGSCYRWGVTSEGNGTSENTENLNLSDISGDAQYDAASACWEGLWRMPTKYEMQELLNLCSWEETAYNGIEGYQVTGPNGNSIFIPYAGGSTYWTSSPYKEYGFNDAYGLTLYPYNDISIYYRYIRSNCCYVRPVFGGNKVVSFDAISRDIEYRDITSTTAQFGIIVMQDEDGTITSYGACWSTDARPTIDDERYTFYEYNEYDGNDDYSECLRDVHLENLMPNTKYYIRAYAVSGDNVVYGEVKDFTTLPVESGQEGGHSYIDLGLPSGVKWAMCNYGSYNQSPWDYGDYVSWGGRYNYDYEWNPNNCPTYGIEMGDISGSEYDYVNESWGGQWRMPTLYEMQELRDYCTWEWISNDDDNNRYAYKVTGPNGNSIILPAYGYYEGNQHYEDHDYQQGTLIGPGYYWTSTPYNDGSNNNAYCLEFGSEYVQIRPNLRYYGLNIRPVIGYNEDLYPKVRMNDVTDITTHSAKCSAYIEYTGTVENYGRGFIWSKNDASPTLENYDDCVYADYYENDYSCEIYNLNSNTVYYVRAFVHTSMGDVYSDVFSFTTLPEGSGQECGHSYIDLGLPSGVKWATCNVGASFPEEYGDYFAWGGTTTKAEYNSSNCPTYGLSISELQTQGYIDGDGNLTPQYDAATVNWGGSWRMPTREEQQELIDDCTWTWTTQNGVNGYKVEGLNGNHVFLPAAGYRDGSSLYYAGSRGDYWSSTPCDNYYYAYYLYFYSSDRYVSSNRRGYGRSVRPVLE